MTFRPGENIVCIRAVEYEQLHIIPAEYLTVGNTYPILSVYSQERESARVCISTDTGRRAWFYNTCFSSNTSVKHILQQVSSERKNATKD